MSADVEEWGVLNDAAANVTVLSQSVLDPRNYCQIFWLADATLLAPEGMKSLWVGKIGGAVRRERGAI